MKMKNGKRLTVPRRFERRKADGMAAAGRCVDTEAGVRLQLRDAVVGDLFRERRNGYSWFGTAPQRALDRYEKWAQENPESK